MTNPPPKPPPRFIPTLTEVVQAGNAASPPAAVPRPGTGGVRAPLPTPVTVPPASARGSSMAPGGGITGDRAASLPPTAPSVPFPPGALAPSGTGGAAASAGIASVTSNGRHRIDMVWTRSRHVPIPHSGGGKRFPVGGWVFLA